MSRWYSQMTCGHKRSGSQGSPLVGTGVMGAWQSSSDPVLERECKYAIPAYIKVLPTEGFQSCNDTVRCRCGRVRAQAWQLLSASPRNSNACSWVGFPALTRPRGAFPLSFRVKLTMDLSSCPLRVRELHQVILSL